MDSLIRYCSEEIALDGSSGCDIDRLWSFAENFYFRQGIVQNLDDDYKGFIWPLLLQEEGIELWVEDVNSAERHQIIDSIPWNYQDISPFVRTQLRLFASADRQWINLTYKTKADSKIQPLAFELLSCISRYRHEGIDRIQLCKETKQEPRSVFGRIQALEDASLISKVSISRSKAQTALLVLKRFESENSTMNESVAQVSGGQIYNTDKIRHQICSVVQEFKNGVCRHVDARTKVGLNQNKWERRYFSRQTSFLHNNGYIRKCLTFLPNAPDRYIRCLQFLKPFPIPISENSNQDIDLSDADDNAEEEDLEDDESQYPIKGEFDSSFLQPLEDESLMVPQWSRFNPLEFQCYVAVRNSGLDGLITLRILQKLTGLKFNKPLFKVLGSLVENKSSVPDYLSHLVLTRIEDKTNKSRQYRYFTLQNQIQRLLRDGLSVEEITRLTRNVQPTAGEFPPYNPSLFTDVNALSPDNSSAIYSPDGMTVLPKKRGRPKKGTPKNVSSISSPVKQENSFSMSMSSPVVPASQPDLSSSQNTSSTQPSLMFNSDASGLNAEASVDVNDNTTLASRPSDLDSLYDLSVKNQRQDTLKESPPPPKPETSALDVPFTPFSSIDLNLPQILPGSSDTSISEGSSVLASKRPRQVVDFVMLQRKSLIMTYLEEKNGAFEISKKMYEDLADLKVRRDPNSVRTVMDRRTFRQTLDKLLHEKKVRKVVLAFENGFGKLVRKDIIAKYTMKSEDPRLYDIKHQMMSNESEFRNDKEILRGVEIDIPDKPRSKRRKQALPVEEVKTRRESRAFEKNLKKQKEKEDPMELAQKLLESLAPTLTQPGITEDNTLESQPLSKSSTKLRKDRYAPIPELDYYPSAIHSSKRSVKRLKSDFTAEEDDTLIRAVVIIQVQYGGVHRNIKWEAVQKCLPSRDITSLSRRYISIRQHTKYKSLQQFLLANWTRMYQDAVTRGDLTSYPENVDDFDPMPSVKASYRPYIISSSDISSSNLPSSLEQLYEKYDVEMVKDGKDPKDLLFDSSLSAMARMNIYSDIPFIKSVHEEGNKEEEDKKVELTTLEAKSTIKSILAIPDSDYDSQFAQSRLLKFPEGALLSAHDDLIRKDIIARVHSESNRVQPGRNYHFTDKFANSLKSSFPPFLLLQASRFYSFLAEGFREGKSHMIQETCNSGTMACVLDLFCRGKVETSIINSKFNEYGLAEGYRTRLLEHENIKMDLILSKKGDDSIEPIDSSKLVPPPNNEPRLWLDGNRGIIDRIWLEIKQAIVYQLLRRPGIARNELGRLLSPGLDNNELREVIEYFLMADAAIEKDGLFLSPGFYHKLF
ncbi:transcription factor TFIIIC complex B box binding subunit Sfc3 [Schizosaccharomyces osmophilus]|uniref:Transcription factor TFIIIC complex B box binding subunit Sfc3 n=1 Tax=Schizosaccharomyces osmophilus TaxID=2545709 RepID=A0AAE9WB68_9SCHI|nr:transcription factor TFIIIC complex B box binding subunit Sfc3 [Schizosaccharomyces osmophilus]WBW72216.1 transcription factor TFIIIC complex B box binding subunit Sfc3 [Schizosaccharomyces osmophilus]